MEKKVDKKKIVKYAAAGLLTFALGTGITITAYEASVDHDLEYCHLCDIFGLEHQANAINKGNNKSRYTAIYDPGEEVKRNNSSIADYTSDHVINYAYANIEANPTEDASRVNYEIQPLKDGKGYSLNELGFLTNDQYRGERVDVYDYRDGHSILIRTFKK